LAASAVAQAQEYLPSFQSDPQADRIIAAFKDWTTRHSVPNASIAIMRGYDLVGSYGKGSYSASAPAPVASLSKAITAVAIAKLVNAGKITFTTPINKPLSSFFRTNKPKDKRVPGITVGQLLTHSGGITYDPSQASQGGEILLLPHNQTNLSKQAQIAFTKNLGAAPGSRYYYNNMNYAVLGLIIETLTRKTYEKYCLNEVLTPLGITKASLNPSWRVMSSWGGWKISANDYARFLEYFLPSLGLLSLQPAQWPRFDLGGGAFYSLGALMRENPPGYNFWHSGSWQYSPPPASFGGYFTAIQENVRYAVAFEPTVDGSAFNDLDASLYNAAVGTSNEAGPAASKPNLLPR
jgi:CubicO group peptidase (beta-lactamase class C family)